MSKFGGAAQGEEVKEVKEVEEVTEVEQVRMDVTVLNFSWAYSHSVIGSSSSLSQKVLDNRSKDFLDFWQEVRHW